MAYPVEPRDANGAPPRGLQTHRATTAGPQSREGGPCLPPRQFPPALFAAPRDRGPSQGRTNEAQTRSADELVSHQ